MYWIEKGLSFISKYVEPVSTNCLSLHDYEHGKNYHAWTNNGGVYCSSQVIQTLFHFLGNGVRNKISLCRTPTLHCNSNIRMSRFHVLKIEILQKLYVDMAHTPFQYTLHLRGLKSGISFLYEKAGCKWWWGSHHRPDQTPCKWGVTFLCRHFYIREPRDLFPAHLR